MKWDEINPQSDVAAHGHPLADIGMDMPSLVQLAEALGGGIYPGLGNGINDTMPNQDSVAPGFPLNLFFVVPQNQVKQQALKLSFQPGAFRTYSTAGGSTSGGTDHGHAGDSISSLSISINNDAGHQHRMLVYQGNVGSDGGGQWQKFLMEDSIGGINHEEQVWLHTDNGISADIYTDPGGGGGVHNHTDVSHSHTPGTTGGETAHTHIVTGGGSVSEGTNPDNMHVMVDGTDVTSQLGGPFNSAQTDLDVTNYAAPGSGIHTVQITSTTNLGRITGWVRNSSIINALRP